MCHQRDRQIEVWLPAIYHSTTTAPLIECGMMFLSFLDNYQIMKKIRVNDGKMHGIFPFWSLVAENLKQ
jgi:hypothetical protein